VKNRGLKLILKSFAQERAEFAADLRDLVQAEGGEAAEGGGWLAAAHRGWINIKAAMTIGQPATEAVVLAEVSRGERTARQRYRQVLESALPAQIEEVVRRQYEQLQVAAERIRELRGQEGARTVVRLFDSDEDARAAVAALVEAGFSEESVEQAQMDEVVVAYRAQEEGHTMAESTFAGAILGAVLGVILGVVALISAGLAPDALLFGGSLLQTQILTFLAALVVGILFGGLIGAIIGLGIVQDDAYRYTEGLKRGSLLLLVRADAERAARASDIMHAVSTRRRPGAPEPVNAPAGH
jgi:uncharacterized protein (TIGR02284 family)